MADPKIPKTVGGATPFLDENFTNVGNLNFRAGNLDFGRLVNPAEFTVDLSTAVAQPKVVREGFKVPNVTLDPSKAAFFLDNLSVISPRDEPRVVVQSIPPGTLAVRGTAVDLTFVSTKDIKFDIFEAPHQALIDRPITDLTEGLLLDPDIRQTLLKYDTADAVPAADRAKLISAFKAQANIDVDDANTNTSFTAAFRTAQNAAAFK